MNNVKKQRSTRQIVVFSVILTILILSAVLLSIFVVNMFSMLKDAENWHIGELDDMLETAWNYSLRNEHEITRSWSSWDETYNFVLGKNPGYKDMYWSDLTPFLQNNFNIVIIKDNENNDKMSIAFDDAKMEETTLPEGLSEYLNIVADYYKKLYIENSENDYFNLNLGSSGYIQFNGKTYFVSAMPVMKSDESGISVGSFFKVNEFNGEALKNFSGINANFNIYHIADGGKIEKSFEIREDNVIISHRMKDLFGNESLIFEMVTEKRIFDMGFNIVVSTSIYILVTLFLFGALIVYIMNFSIINPLQKLSEDINSVDMNIKIDDTQFTANKELNSLVSSINDMVDRVETSYKSIQESIISINVLKNILNGMDANIYVSDPDSYEVMFINDKMKAEYGITEDITGDLCWKYFQDNCNEKCGNCPVEKLQRENDAIEWEEFNEKTKRYYRHSDRMIEWTEGKLAHLKHSTDITSLKKVENSLERRLSQQELMTKITQTFIYEKNFSQSLDKIIQMTSEFLDTDTLHFSVIDHVNYRFELKHIWAKDKDRYNGLYEYISTHMNSNRERAARYINLLKEMDQLVLNDTSRIPRYKFLQDYGALATIIIPVHLDGEVYGMLQFDKGRPYEWTESDKTFAQLVVSIISGIIAKEKISSQVNKLSSIVKSSSQFISYLDENNKIAYVNPAFKTLTGYDEKELFEKGMQLIYTEKHVKWITEEVLPEVSETGNKIIELPIICSDGTEKIVALSVFKMMQDDSLIGFGGIGTDMTENRKLQQALIEAKELAEQGSKAKSDFLSRMSHEMRTPMNAIIGMTSIGKNSNDIEKKEYCLDKIENASKHLLGVINDILDMSKIEANKFEMYQTEFEFEKMLIKISNIINFKIEEKKQNFNVNIDTSIPNNIISDEQRLTQVIMNLLTNAVKFTPEEGRIDLFVRLLEESGDNIKIKFSVIDSGIGIAEEQKSKLFNSFEQADGGISRKYGGTGLGLAISRRIIEMLGGSIWVDSKIGEGSDFSFTIIAKKGRQIPVDKLIARIDRKNLNILAVDDSSETREYFTHLMNMYRFPCTTVEDGFTALEMIKNNKDRPYNIIFADWKMPGMDGIELTRRIKQITGESAIVIMISVSEWSEIEKEAIEAGVDNFIPKPLFPSVLLNCINRCLKKDQSADETIQEQHIAKNDFTAKTILLAEDVDINREIVMTLLEDTNIRIDCAENGFIAADMFKKSPGRYDIILMDIHMPECDGYESTRIIRSSGYTEAKSVPIIAMTANVFREDIERCLAAGMNDHIGKPVDLAELLHKLNKYLKST